jgi:VCBS repeat-containing protein
MQLDAAGSVDEIRDFEVGKDRLGLSDGLQEHFPDGFSDSALVIGKAAATLEHRVIYDPITGTLWFDEDGTAGEHQAVAFAILTTRPASLSAADFLVGLNHPPVARPDTANLFVPFDLGASGNVLDNDSDVDDPLRVVAVEGQQAFVGQAVKGKYGSLSLTAGGNYVYVLDQASVPQFSISPLKDTFSYSLDSSGDEGVSAVIDFTISPAPLGLPRAVGAIPATPAVADFNNDGWVEPLGWLNDRQGFFTYNPAFAEALSHYQDRVARDGRLADLDADGNIDVILNVYSDPTRLGSFGLVLYGDGSGGVREIIERPDVRGYGETILTADFDNDGDLDAFLPVYTYPGASASNYLLLNESGVLGDNVATQWGVDLTGYPQQFKVEGAQAVDTNFDGKIDFYTASNLFINSGTRFDPLTLSQRRFDEGANLFDFDNDGDFDLVLMEFSQSGGPRLYEWSGEEFIDRGIIGSERTRAAIGMNVADIDQNGWLDIVGRHSGGFIMYMNDGGSFSEVRVRSDIYDTFAFGAFDRDRRIDLIARSPRTLQLLQNNLPQGDGLSLSLLGPSGEANQHGRSVRLASIENPELILARSVESGSGMLSQNQYEMLFGLPAPGAYRGEAFFADRVVTFTAGADQSISVFADERVVIIGSARSELMGGGAGDDSLEGKIGADVLVGAGGADLLSGGPGGDVFAYLGLEESAGDKADTIMDFNPSEGDSLRFDFSHSRFRLTDVQDSSGQATLVDVDRDGDGQLDTMILSLFVDADEVSDFSVEFSGFTYGDSASLAGLSDILFA